MGIVFGHTGTKEPSFALLLKKNGYEVRKYQSYVIAETPADGSDNEAFRALAKYIGVFGNPENIQKTQLDMTAPVLMDAKPQKIAMTSPVITSTKMMAFVLPFEYSDVKSVPSPTNNQIKIRMIPARTVAVDIFSGWYSDDVAQQQLKMLCEKLISDGLMKPGDAPTWSIAQYHPPFTLPFFRRNEVWVDVNKEDIKET